jgi:hypothetical protein
MTYSILSRLVEVPEGWENGGNFYPRTNARLFEIGFGDLADEISLTFSFDWVRSFRYISEGTLDHERDNVDVMDALLSELSLPYPPNLADDYYDKPPYPLKGPPRLFRVYHFKAGLFEIVASNWSVS